MTPDFGYYVHRFDVASFAHTVPGSFVVCLPIGIFLLLLFYLVRKPVCFVLPMPHREALFPLCSTFPTVGLRNFAMILLSILLGAWSHILWDSFTHQTGWFVQRISWLREPLFTVGSTLFRGHSSSPAVQHHCRRSRPCCRISHLDSSPTTNSSRSAGRRPLALSTPGRC